MSFIVPFSKESDDELLRLSHKLQQKAYEINNGIRSIDQTGLSEEELRYLYELDMLSSPQPVRSYLLSSADDSSRLLGAAADYMGDIPEDSQLKPTLNSSLEGLVALLQALVKRYFPDEME